MSGGEVAIMRRRDSPSSPYEDCIIASRNTCLYGATGGRVFINGRAGERFAVRNSLAETVDRGHGRPPLRVHDRPARWWCSARLGKRRRRHDGRRSGYCCVDEDGSFPTKRERRGVSMPRASRARSRGAAQALIEAHVAKTGSPRAVPSSSPRKEYLPKLPARAPLRGASPSRRRDEAVSAGGRQVARRGAGGRLPFVTNGAVRARGARRPPW